jgi:hypothetical protein
LSVAHLIDLFDAYMFIIKLIIDRV